MDLKSIRKNKGLTQKEAADFLGIPLRSYKRYETLKSKNFKIATLSENLSKYNKIKKVDTGEKLNLLIVGAGFVGETCAKVYSKEFNVVLVDNNLEKIKKLRNKYIVFDSISKVGEIDYALICLPTNYDEKKKTFSTSAIDETVEKLCKKYNDLMIIIKSTVAIGYTDKLGKKYKKDIYFMPEFLREKSALEDALHPSRILIGCNKISEKLRIFSSKVQNCSLNPIKVNFVTNKEAEAIKLLSNSYLAMRVAFFNEIDNLAIDNDLNTKKIITSLGLDKRIGDEYNDPSFCYGGYCLPKDLKVLKEQSKSSLFNAIDSSNEKRKEKIVSEILKSVENISKPTIGFYLSEGANHRGNATLEIINKIKEFPVKTVVFDGNDLQKFQATIKQCDLIVTDRYDPILDSVKFKVFCRSIKY